MVVTIAAQRPPQYAPNQPSSASNAPTTTSSSPFTKTTSTLPPMTKPSIWNAGDTEYIKTLCNHTDVMFCVNFGTQSNQIVSGSFYETIRVWDVKTGMTNHVI